MRINEAGLNLVMSYEGCELSSYYDIGGTLTIGFGSTRNVVEDMNITVQEAKERLQEDLKEAEDAVNELVKVRLTSNQFSSLVALVFNIGSGAFSESTLLKILNIGEYEDLETQLKAIPDQFLRWNKVDGEFSFGLLRRRVAEIELFITP